ncbi:hypothetical protein [Sphingomonas fuzhouensis]|uniref:hypothetical protein n=1 Tax=Sphingomonas fuzhouensis TaxID=3106033 RepID=UPI002AFDCAAF|nr:hypothetical protein [Sphingomonas sp. SGZ-02]
MPPGSILIFFAEHLGQGLAKHADDEIDLAGQKPDHRRKVDDELPRTPGFSRPSGRVFRKRRWHRRHGDRAVPFFLDVCGPPTLKFIKSLWHHHQSMCTAPLQKDPIADAHAYRFASRLRSFVHDADGDADLLRHVIRGLAWTRPVQVE